MCSTRNFEAVRTHTSTTYKEVVPQILVQLISVVNLLPAALCGGGRQPVENGNLPARFGVDAGDKLHRLRHLPLPNSLQQKNTKHNVSTTHNHKQT